MTILAIDPSLNSSGYAYLDQHGVLHTGRIMPKGLTELERLAFIAESFESLINKVEIAHSFLPVDLVVFEGYAMGFGKNNNPGRSFSIGEGGGVMKLIAHRQGIDVLLVPPTNLKKFVTGKGNAKKAVIPGYIMTEWGYTIKQNDEADAFCLLKMAQAYVSSRHPRKKHRRDALETCSLLPGRVCS